MHPDLIEMKRRIEAAIVRIPDGLSTDAGELVRHEWAEALAKTMGGTLDHGWLSLPFQLCALTDPVLVRLRNGWVVLDHPVTASALEWVFSLDTLRAPVYACDGSSWWSLYEHRHPRLLVVPDKGRRLSVSCVANRLHDWHGPFEARPSLVRDRKGGLYQARNPVDPAWLARHGARARA
jgi:hypothetical protein